MKFTKDSASSKGPTQSSGTNKFFFSLILNQVNLISLKTDEYQLFWVLRNLQHKFEKFRSLCKINETECNYLRRQTLYNKVFHITWLSPGICHPCPNLFRTNCWHQIHNKLIFTKFNEVAAVKLQLSRPMCLKKKNYNMIAFCFIYHTFSLIRVVNFLKLQDFMLLQLHSWQSF